MFPVKASPVTLLPKVVCTVLLELPWKMPVVEPDLSGKANAPVMLKALLVADGYEGELVAVSV